MSSMHCDGKVISSGEAFIGDANGAEAKLSLQPTAYIVTDNRGKRYLVFAGSTEYENAVMFNYEMRALYE